MQTMQMMRKLQRPLADKRAAGADAAIAIVSSLEFKTCLGQVVLLFFGVLAAWHNVLRNDQVLHHKFCLKLIIAQN
jgi:hypothetical protein